MLLVKRYVALVFVLALFPLAKLHATSIEVTYDEIPEFIGRNIPHDFIFTLKNMRSHTIRTLEFGAINNDDFYYNDSLSTCSNMLPSGETCQLALGFFSNEIKNHTLSFNFRWNNGHEWVNEPAIAINTSTANSTWTFKDTSHGLPSNRINKSFSSIADNALYLTTANGLAIADTSVPTEQLTFVTQLMGFYLLDVYARNEKIYAVGANGLFVADIPANENYQFQGPFRTGLDSRSAINAVTLLGDTLYVGTTHGLAITHADNPTTFTIVAEGLTVNDIATDEDTLFIATGDGAYQVDLNNYQLTKLSINSDKPFTTIDISEQANSDKKIVSIGSTQGLWNSYDDGSTFIEHQLKDKWITDVSIYSTIKFVTTTTGLHIFYKDNQFTELENYSTHNIVVDEQRIFIGGENGLAILS